ncbi:MAG TPA: YfhE family protein [Sporosarcina psychrophila]|uniref:YfhE family protein n=1 Tax=Sporosarcina psychrophila TaxID=1476 RepID=A0A921G356_SPOPS|nr:YfhE family protein [Sporosarcina psychrophila]
MTEKKPPHEQLTEKNNGLSSEQEVLYQEEYKKADKVAENENKDRENNKKD